MSVARLSGWYATFADPAPDSTRIRPGWHSLPNGEKGALAVLLAVLGIAVLLGIIKFVSNFFDPGEH